MNVQGGILPCLLLYVRQWSTINSKFSMKNMGILSDQLDIWVTSQIQIQTLIKTKSDVLHPWLRLKSHTKYHPNRWSAFSFMLIVFIQIDLFWRLDSQMLTNHSSVILELISDVAVITKDFISFVTINTGWHLRFSYENAEPTSWSVNKTFGKWGSRVKQSLAVGECSCLCICTWPWKQTDSHNCHK